MRACHPVGRLERHGRARGHLHSLLVRRHLQGGAEGVDAGSIKSFCTASARREHTVLQTPALDRGRRRCFTPEAGRRWKEPSHMRRRESPAGVSGDSSGAESAAT